MKISFTPRCSEVCGWDVQELTVSGFHSGVKPLKRVTIMSTSQTTSLKRGVNDISPARIEVRSYKYDGALHRTWDAHLVRQEGTLIILDATFPDEIVHDLLGTITAGTHSLEYYWLDRWYNVFRFAQPDGALRSYYCNINVPAKFDGETLSYVDLDLDILVNPDFSYKVLDTEEFRKNARVYGYPDEVQANAQRALDDLTSMIHTRAFPFSDL